MVYDKEILRILTEVGSRGLSVAKIARHVHHACNSLFVPIDYDDVHRYVAQFLLRNSKNPDSIIEKTDRGIYRMNLKSQETQQLMLQFAAHDEDTVQETPAEDLSLSLF
ncbi:MAG: hypothetical protein IJM78_02970 [Prevotella sp.]|jgi:hypothetical protein|nr:hypothetical protein [Prevotella sp.]